MNSLPQAPVEINVAEETNSINIKSVRSSATIKGMDPSEFPLNPITESEANPVILDAGLLKTMINEVAFAAADDDSRPVFTSVHIEIGNEKLTFAAADSFRLAVRTAALPGNEQEGGSFLVPARTLIELGRILPAEGTVQMIITPNVKQVLFRTERIDLIAQLMEGTFPNFRQIIPKEHSTRAVVETKEFAAAVKSVTPFARDSSNITRLKVTSGDEEGGEPNALTIEATAEDVGNNVSTINAAVDGPEQQIIFNVKYLADVLSVIGTPEVALELTSDARPGVIRPVGPADYTYVIMPMSTNR